MGDLSKFSDQKRKVNKIVKWMAYKDQSFLYTIITWKKIKRAKAIINNPIVCKTATEQPSKNFSRQSLP